MHIFHHQIELLVNSIELRNVSMVSTFFVVFLFFVFLIMFFWSCVLSLMSLF